MELNQNASNYPMNAHILSLSSDALRHVVWYLNTGQLLQIWTIGCRALCNKLGVGGAVTSYWRYWYGRDDPVSASLISAVLSRFPHLQEISLVFSLPSNLDGRLDQLLSSFPACKTLKSLRFSHIGAQVWNPDLLNLSVVLPNLENLAITHSSGGGMLPKHLKNLPDSLRTLYVDSDLSNLNDPHIISSLPRHLDHLTLYCNIQNHPAIDLGPIVDVHFPATLSFLHLAISWSTNIIPSLPSSLHTFHRTYKPILDQTTVLVEEYYGNFPPNLKVLKVYGTTPFSSKIAGKLPSGDRGLVKLVWHCVTSILSFDIVTLRALTHVENMPKSLEVAEIWGLKEHFPTILHTPLSEFSKLTKLRLTGWKAPEFSLPSTLTHLVLQESFLVDVDCEALPPSLITLNLNDSYCLNVKAVQALPRTLKRLTMAQLMGAMDPNSFPPHLVYLDITKLSPSRCIDDDFMETFSSHMVHLETFKTCSDPHTLLTVRCFATLPPKITKLRLAINGPMQIYDVGRLPHSLKRLQLMGFTATNARFNGPTSMAHFPPHLESLTLPTYLFDENVNQWFKSLRYPLHRIHIKLCGLVTLGFNFEDAQGPALMSLGVRTSDGRWHGKKSTTAKRFYK
jgi:hypothetical protein